MSAKNNKKSHNPGDEPTPPTTYGNGTGWEQKEKPYHLPVALLHGDLWKTNGRLKRRAIGLRGGILKKGKRNQGLPQKKMGIR